MADEDLGEYRDWTVKRSRSRSTLRPEELVRVTDHRLRWPANAVSRRSVERVNKAPTLKRFVFAGWKGSVGAVSTLDEPSSSELSDFYDLVDSLLQFDPTKRMTAREALFHPFFEEMRKMYIPPAFLQQNAALTPHIHERSKLV